MFIVQTFMIYLRTRLKFGVILRTLFKTLIFKLSVYVRKLHQVLFSNHIISSYLAVFPFDMLVGV